MDYAKRSHRTNEYKKKGLCIMLKFMIFKMTIIWQNLTVFLWLKTSSCPFVRHFCKLFWDYIMIIWDENIVYFFNWEKKICFGRILIFQLQIIMISSQNNVQKYGTKGHEQVYNTLFFVTFLENLNSTDSTMTLPI